MQIFLRIIKTAWHGFWRNGWLSLVAIFIMMQVLLLVGLFFIIDRAVSTITQNISSSIDVAVFFKDYVPESDIVVFQEKITDLPGVKSIQFISRQAAMEKYTQSGRQNSEVLNVIDNDVSFFPASLEIKLEQSKLAEDVNERVVAQDQGKIISDTSLGRSKNIIDKLRKFNQLLTWSDLGLSLILLIIALLIIFNTIRITIFARREEIEIMKLVGATDWYIRWPFILEGTLYGLVGALLAFGLTVAIYYGMKLLLGGEYWSLPAVSDVNELFTYALIVRIFIFQLFFGVLVGAISSYLSTRKHLRI